MGEGEVKFTSHYGYLLLELFLCFKIVFKVGFVMLQKVQNLNKLKLLVAYL